MLSLVDSERVHRRYERRSTFNPMVSLSHFSRFWAATKLNPTLEPDDASLEKRAERM